MPNKLKLSSRHRIPNLAVGMTVQFDNKLWTISSESTYYVDDVNLLLVPLHRHEDGPSDD